MAISAKFSRFSVIQYNAAMLVVAGLKFHSLEILEARVDSNLQESSVYIGSQGFFSGLLSTLRFQQMQKCLS